MVDETEDLRRARVAEINAEATDQQKLEAKYGQVWTTNELLAAYEVADFAAPYVAVRRKSDGVVGSLEFQHSPRFYFNFQEHR